jgi:hypothetical protein
MQGEVSRISGALSRSILAQFDHRMFYPQGVGLLKLRLKPKEEV